MSQGYVWTSQIIHQPGHEKLQVLVGQVCTVNSWIQSVIELYCLCSCSADHSPTPKHWFYKQEFMAGQDNLSIYVDPHTLTGQLERKATHLISYK